MDADFLFKTIQEKQSFLCIGLDTDIRKIPKHLLNSEDPIFEFNKAIIEATHDLCIAYKPNLAFYEAGGSRGIRSLEKTMRIIPEGIFTIADAKRGDIGNTSQMYAEAYLEGMGFDSITVAPYMGHDSVKPFLKENKWVILLALTSNSGSQDFQILDVGNGNQLFEQVLHVSKKWANENQLMYVVGATHPKAFIGIRKIIPDHFLLVPGVGAQGGDLNEVAEHGMNNKCGLLVNSSRGIIYASSGEDFAEAARTKALELKKQMEIILDKRFKHVS
jgi:orotidine-5'-phosphate decarboxylase